LISEYIPLFPMNALQQQAFEEEVVRQVGVLRSEGYNASRDMFQPRLKGRRVEAVITDFGQLKGNPLLDMTAEAAQNLEHGWEEFQSSWMSFLEEPEEKWSE
ncbi:MAG: hypothetical protein U1C71_04875, partial [archaeon]|nr:hypothetical protein [archaeon]